MTFSKDLVAASATPMILAILQIKDTYGYAIIRKVQEISDNQIAWTDGMLYPVLHRLESVGSIDSYWQEAENGRRRKYYHITATGEKEYQLLLSQWTVVQQALKMLIDERQG
ncbi:MAG: PadR family transcriptional regulator [Sphaerochaetaceae bacterium]